ncbi:MAG: hypothetical protein ACOZCO_04240 [Bacteroidota bacterium]
MKKKVLLDHFSIKFTPSESSTNMVSHTKVSSFRLALKEARFLSGRDIETGEFNMKKFENCPAKWSGIIIYLIILDQIGSIVIRKGEKEIQNKIQQTLQSFSDLNDKERDAIVALRNSLAHDFNLSNVPYKKEKNEFQFHRFILDANINKPAIALPDNDEYWKGSYFEEPTTYSHTEINIIKLAEIFENIFKKVVECIENDNYTIVNNMPELELKGRYDIVVFERH